MLLSARPVYRFAKSEDGGMLIWLAGATIAVGALLGTAIDFGRWISARDQTERAIQAASEAGARALTLTPSDRSGALTIARKTYAAIVADRLETVDEDIQFAFDNRGRSIVATGNVQIEMPFVALFGPSKLPLRRNSAVLAGLTTNMPKPPPVDTSRVDLEIVAMLDISESMSGGRMSALKTAMSDLIDQTIWPQPAKHTARLALVPVSGDIRPPPSATPFLAPAGPGFRQPAAGGWWTSESWYAPTDCVTALAAEKKSRNSVPTTQQPLPRAYQPADADGAATAPCATPDGIAVVPLTNDRRALKERLAGLEAGGETAIDAGLQWSHNVVSPDWAAILGSGSVPAPYLADAVRKVAILITDGGFALGPSPPASGANAGDGEDPAHRAALQYRQAVRVCADMKRQGIDIHAVGVGLSSDIAASLLIKTCASTPAQAHVVDSASDLADTIGRVAQTIKAATQANPATPATVANNKTKN